MSLLNVHCNEGVGSDERRLQHLRLTQFMFLKPLKKVEKKYQSWSKTRIQRVDKLTKYTARMYLDQINVLLGKTVSTLPISIIALKLTNKKKMN